MKRYIYSATTPQEYNNKQSEVGSTLKTYRGSPIKRSNKYGVGKEIGGDIYFHEMYADKIVPADILAQAESALTEAYPDFQYNCIRYSPKTGDISFQEVPDFDTAREPRVGDYVTVKSDGTIKTGHSDYIFHHKWLWVDNNYPGFDVSESWSWSRQWLNTLQETSDGNGMSRWNAQLDKYDLPIEGGTNMKKFKPIKAAVAESISATTRFYPVELDWFIQLLKDNDKNPMLIWLVEQKGFDAFDLDQLYGSAVSDDVLYLCDTNGEDILIDGEPVDPETAIENYGIEAIQPYISDPDTKYILRYLSPDEVSEIDLEEAAQALMNQPYKYSLAAVVNFAKDFVGADYFD